MPKKEDPPQHEPADKFDGTGPTYNTRTEDSGADETDENTFACDMNNDRGHIDVPVTISQQVLFNLEWNR